MAVKARVTIYPRPEILDPQGKAIAGALERLGFDRVLELRAGKSFEIVLSGRKATAEKEVAQICEKLLANTVIEDYSIEILDGDSV